MVLLRFLNTDVLQQFSGKVVPVRKKATPLMKCSPLFVSRLDNRPEQAPKINVDLFGSFTQLSKERESIDERIFAWVDGLSQSWLEESLTYKIQVDGIVRTLPQWVLVTHMFNHQTHHRGQVTTLLSQMGLDTGSTDIPFMP
jgi:uncharacterized damage-inducible protein DinB